MAKSLLASLYTHIRGSQEDVATLSLKYIISQSEELRNAFNKLLGEKMHLNLDTVIKYTCQSTGENLERPDLSGADSNGKELILCEAKFYAGLTDNQPVGYIQRLKNKNGLGLIFICPEARIIGLWDNVIDRCKNAGFSIEKYSDKYALVEGISLSIITWKEIITELQRCAQLYSPELKSDIDQLEGYCDELDSEAFIPFKSEELGSLTAKKQLRYPKVIETTLDLIKVTKNVETSNSSRSSYYGGFEYKMHFNNFIICMAYDEFMWKNNSTIETPLWFTVLDENKNQTEKIREIIHSLPDEYIDDESYYTSYIALTPLTNATLDEVSEDLKNQIMKYMKMF